MNFVRTGLGTTLAALFSLVVLLLLLFLFASVVLSGRTTDLPEAVADRIAERLSEAIAPLSAEFEDVSLVWRAMGTPQLRLSAVTLNAPDQGALMGADAVDLAIDRQALLFEQRIALESLRLEELSVRLRRRADGSLSFPGLGDAPVATDWTPFLYFDTLNGLLATPALASLAEASVDRVVVTIDDATLDRIWSVPDGTVRLIREGGNLDLAFGVSLSGDEGPGRLNVTASLPAAGTSADLSIEFDNVPTRELADLAAGLEWLSLVEAPVSGAARGTLDASGAPAAFSGTLALGEGRLTLPGAERIVILERVQGYFTFVPRENLLRLDAFEVQTSDLDLTAEGQVLADVGGRGNVAQIQVTSATVHPSDFLERTIELDYGSADLRLAFDPFQLDLGRLSVASGAARLQASGQVLGSEDGLNVSLDAEVPHADADTLVALWPRIFAPNARDWIALNVHEADFSDAFASVRLAPDGSVRYAANFAFSDGRVTFQPDLPQGWDVDGYGTLADDRLSIVVAEGFVTAPEGGNLDASGTVFTIPDVSLRPTPGDVDIRAAGSLEATLSLLDEPPLEVFKKADRAPDFATGTAEVHATLGMPLVKDLPIEEVDITAKAEVRGVRSEALFPGRVLTSERLDVELAPGSGVRVGGRFLVDGVPFDGAWTQTPEQDGTGQSTVSGRLTVTPDTLSEFASGVPVTLSGRAFADVEIALGRDGPETLELRSDLAGAALSLEDIGWSKSRETPAPFELDLSLSDGTQVERLRLDAPGLSVNGRVRLSSSGELQDAQFDRIVILDWFDGEVRVRGQGTGQEPAIDILGGTLDVSGLPDSGGEDRGPLSVRLDRVVVSPEIALTGFAADFPADETLMGNFTARINGRAPITGALFPTGNGSSISVRSTDAGAALASAGISPNVLGGTLSLSLNPTTSDGSYNGRLTIDDSRIKDAPILAEILSAVSIVGILDQLTGTGLSFPQIQADFLLTPDRLSIIDSSAISPAMGLTARGDINLVNETLDIQGVVSPVFVLNALGQMVARQGEGLFGVNYSIQGAQAAPRVIVNPASLLAPGRLRDILRRRQGDRGQ
ncbi:MAG: AsmA-like C-terminal region-containing protein [Pseudomonadota bacterium]